MVWQWLNAQWLWFFVLGLTAVVLFHMRQWQSDEILARRLREQRQSRHRYPFTSTPMISVLVAAWNEAAIIERHIRSFLDLRYPHRELVICAGGQDETRSIACRYAESQVIVLEQHPGEGKQRALAKCFEHMQGEILLLTDADNLFDDYSFEAILSPLIEENEQATSGMTRPLPELMGNAFVVYQWCAEQYGAARQGRYTSLLRGCNAAIRREALSAADGFSKDAPIGTDYELGRALHQRNFRLRFVPESMISNEYPHYFRSYLRQQSRWLRVAILRGWAERDWATLSVVNGFLFYLTPPLLIIFSPVLGDLSLCAGILMMLHMLCTRVRIVVFGRSYLDVPIPRHLVWRLATYWLYDMCVRLISLGQLIPGRMRWRW